jgi:predicted permease
MNRPVAISLRMYRALARAFPYEFKNAYGDELVQVTEEAIEPIWRRHGVLGLVRLLVDIAIRVPAEHLAEFRQDIRYGLRMLAASPGFTAVALVSLSLGAAVATSAFSELNGMVLRDLPGVAKPDELVMAQAPASYPQYQRYRELTDVFSSTFAYVAPVPFGVSLGGRTERTWGHLVTPSYFPTLGLHPAAGRFFDEQQGQPGQPPAAVVSYRYWQDHLGADPSVIGKALRINGYPTTIIGIGPRDFLGASPMFFAADVWLPVSVGGRVAPELADNALERRDLTMFQVVGRLKPGVTTARAEAELDAMARQMESEFGSADQYRKGRGVLLLQAGRLIPIRKQDLPFLTGFVIVLAGLVVLIACANVANMMLARAAERRREIAVRLALGASRFRLIRQLLTESMLLAAGAGVLGFCICAWLMHGVSQARMPTPMPMTWHLQPDLRVLLFALALTVLTGLAFGLAPALQATRMDLTPALKEGGNVRFRRHRRLSLRNLLVVQQVAGSLALLLLTAFLVIGVRKTVGTEVGFDPRRLYLISLDPVRDGYSPERAAAFFPKLLERVQGLPSVTAASLTDTVPVSMNGNGWVPFTTAGAGDANSRVVHGALKYTVGKDYFETLGIPIVLGRGFRKADEANDAPAVIVSEKLVREYWKGEDPLGRRIETGSYEANPYPGGIFLGTFDYRAGTLGRRRVVEVVGVAKDAKMDLMMAGVPPVLYFPLRPADYAHPSLQGVTLMVRAAPGVDAAGAVWREVSAMDANLTPFNARTMPEQVDRFIFVFRVATYTYGVIGVSGLILAAAGLAGVTAYSVAQRGREIGIRIALGARSGDVLRLVMKEGAVLVAVGTIVGLAGAWAGSRLVSSAESVAAKAIATTSDPLVVVGIPVLLAGLALLACYVPARRSLRIDPVVALRQE